MIITYLDTLLAGGTGSRMGLLILGEYGNLSPAVTAREDSFIVARISWISGL